MEKNNLSLTTYLINKIVLRGIDINTGEEKLIKAVIEQQIKGLFMYLLYKDSGKIIKNTRKNILLKRSRDDKRYILYKSGFDWIFNTNNEDFSFYCNLLGINVEWLRNNIKKTIEILIDKNIITNYKIYNKKRTTEK